MFIVLLLGFSSGLPLFLTSKTLQAWMTFEGVDLKVIGLFSLVGLPYTLKFLWAPIFDRFTLPFLGRRRGWLVVSQLLLAASIAVLAFSQPKESPWLVALIALVVAFFSATQDIVVDAYRREALADRELGIGSTVYIYGYRVAMWVSSGVALGFSQYMSWTSVYLLMAACCAVGLIASFWTKEPDIHGEAPKNIKEAVIDPFAEFLKRRGAWEVLIFILLYKLGDTMAGTMATPFYIKIGFSAIEIAAIAKTFGIFSAMAGGLVGGICILRFSVTKCLFLFGILQAASTACFSILANIGHSIPALTWVIAFEDFSGGMGTAAFAAFMAAQTNKRYTATQYALLTSLMGVPRVFISAPTGFMVEALGWHSYFIVCTLVAIPGMLLIFRMNRFSATESQ